MSGSGQASPSSPIVLIDRASTYEIANAFLHDDLADVYPWALETMVRVTSLLCREQSVCLQSVQQRPSSAVYEALESGCRSYASVLNLDHGRTTLIRARTKEWCGANLHVLRDVAYQIERDETNGLRWLDFGAYHHWGQLVHTHGALFPEDLIGEVALGVEVPEADLKALLIDSRRPTFMQEYQRSQPDSDLRVHCRRAHTLGALMRGFTQYVEAQDLGLQLASHPMRGVLWRSLSGPASIAVEVPLVERYVAALLIHLAAREQGAVGRLGRYFDGVARVRAAYQSRESVQELLAVRDATPDSGAEEARTQAIRFLRASGVDLSASQIAAIAAQVLDGAAGIGLAVIGAHYGISVLDSILVDLGIGVANFALRPAQRATEAVASSDYVLRRLADSHPGLIRFDQDVAEAG
ncbi:MAG: hypothetical protein IPK72_23745 [Candidatus Eisenbacteria bacterium]|nr:hypothetical protein [Candidatus Eisenbacteria bacterium]